MGKSTINELVSLVGRLQTERNGHVEEIARIDEAFSQLGLDSAGTTRRGPGRPRGGAKRAGVKAKSAAGRPAKRGKKRKFRTTANELIVELVKKSGAKGISSGDIKKRWAAAGRPGEPYNTLGELVRTKKIVKKNIKGQRGSRYSAS
ncbi:MAG: hypothetical protein DHS20C16_00170 [Phycisphaerae bacterium]|nr:MAG: hypothetical protein DHS20C16_00170 [Phycisphaerae bacterium]